MSTKPMHNKTKCLIGLILIAGLSACDADTNENDAKNVAATTSVEAPNSHAKMKVVKSKGDQKKVSQKMTLTGQIIYKQVEGGFYGFVTNNGDKYMPSGLKSEYLQNGLIVELKVELMPDMLTFQQFGDVVKVLEVKVLDTSKVSGIHESM
ncbi:MAG: hypothetical protein ACJASL_002894 [Paraglaciecola sp.]|jgi:hypothetical protein